MEDLISLLCPYVASTPRNYIHKWILTFTILRSCNYLLVCLSFYRAEVLNGEDCILFTLECPAPTTIPGTEAITEDELFLNELCGEYHRNALSNDNILE